jgi:two-component system nitrate/nitrite response regulator NarL
VSDRAITVLVADGHPLFLEAIGRTIRQRPELQLVAETPDGAAALAAVTWLDPDVAVLEADLPGLGGVRILRALSREGRRTRVLLLWEECRPDHTYEALAEGAAGCLSKRTTADELCRAISAAGRGDVYLPTAVQGAVASEIRLRARGDRPLLTAREHQILSLIAAGSSLPAIAARLHLGVTTVKTHAAHLYEKLGVTDRAAATAVGMRRGLID